MKKGIVFEITAGKALILEDGGRFTRVRARGDWTVGDVVVVDRGATARSVCYWAVHAAGVLLMLLTIRYGVYHYIGQPATYISVDVNPSVELTVNRLGRVIGATAYNPSGEAVLEGLDLDGKSYDEAVLALMAADAMQPYLADGAHVLFAVSSNEDTEPEMLGELNHLADELHFVQNGIEFLIGSVDWAVAEEAHELGVSPGKLALAEQADADGASLDEVLAHSVSALLDRLEK